MPGQYKILAGFLLVGRSAEKKNVEKEIGSCMVVVVRMRGHPTMDWRRYNFIYSDGEVGKWVWPCFATVSS